MKKILLIDPGKGWGNFVSKLYCYQHLSEAMDSKIIFLTKKSTQAKHYLGSLSFCNEVIYMEENKRGLSNIIINIISFYKNILIIKNAQVNKCFIFHPSLRYVLLAKFAKIKNIWGLGFKFQNFFLEKNKKLYSNYKSKSFQDNETLEFVKKITNKNDINFRPIYKNDLLKKETVGIIIAASGYEKRWNLDNYIEVINFLKKRGFKKFLIISGKDQSQDENVIKEKFQNKLEFIFTANKKIKDVIPHLKLCKFCIGNDTGFAHLSINFNIETIIIYGDCPPQNYSNLMHHVDIDKSVVRSSTSIHSIKVEKVLGELSIFLNGRGGRAVEGARLESV